MGRYKVKPLEDILADKYANLQSYLRLSSHLKRYLPLRDAKHLSWQLTIPQHIYQSSSKLKRTKSIMPQADLLGCVYCQDELVIPMKYPRFNETTYHAYRSVSYIPQAPQECQCGNLKTLTDHKGNLRVYLSDNNEKAFTFRNGPIDLLKCSQSISEIPITNVFDSPRPHTSDPFSYEVRSEIIVNHINLYRTTTHTQNTLLPTESLTQYARVHNIVILGSTDIYFPTGHIIPYSQTKVIFNTPLNSIETRTAHWLFQRPVLTPEEATLKNDFVLYLYHHVLPNYIEEAFSRHTLKISKRLHIPITYAPSAPIVPYLLKLTPTKPLSVYRELTILRLPRFKALYKTAEYDLQDFKYNYSSSRIHIHNPSYRTRKQHLTTLKRERINLLHYLLPRYPNSTPELILKNALNTIPHTTIPTPRETNDTLLLLSQRPL